MVCLRGELLLIKLPEGRGVVVRDGITVVEGNTGGDTDKFFVEFIGGYN